jgi:hypothetical protein
MSTHKMVESMSRINERPVTVSLSNPTDQAECNGGAGIDLVQW